MEKFPFDFKNKGKILRLMASIEEKRDPLCYGAPKQEAFIKEAIKEFYELKKIFKEHGVEIE